MEELESFPFFCPRALCVYGDEFSGKFSIFKKGTEMKKTVALAALFAAVALSACGKKPEAPAPAPAPAAAPAPAPAADASAAAPAASGAAAPAASAASK